MDRIISPMNPLIAVLTEQAQENLVREESVDILNAAFEIEADPDKPDDEGAMKLNVRVDDAFARHIPWLCEELDTFRRICDRYDEDFDRPAVTMLRAALLAKRYELDEIRGRNTARPLLFLITPMVGIWAVAWTVTLNMKESGGRSSSGTGSDGCDGKRMEIRYKEYLNDCAMDPMTLAKVKGRLREFTLVMNRIFERLLPEDGSAGR